MSCAGTSPDICDAGPVQPVSQASVRLGDGGLVISRVGFGCASLMRLPAARQRRNLIAAALGAGLTHFDVARMYGLGAAEAELGRALRGRTGNVTVATKFGIDAAGALRWLGRLQGPARAVLARSSRTRAAVRSQRELFMVPRVYDAAQARRSLDTSLRKLGMDHVDILFLHGPRPQDEIAGHALQEFLEGARAAGKIREWGMSLDEDSSADVLSRLPDPGVVQMRHDLLAEPRPRPGGIAFGALSAHPLIARWLTQAPGARERWTRALGADPLQDDLLAKLLVALTLRQDGVTACLYSTTQPRRLEVAAAVMDSAVPSTQVDGFARCLNDERSGIAALTAR